MYVFRSEIVSHCINLRNSVPISWETVLGLTLGDPGFAGLPKCVSYLLILGDHTSLHREGS